MLCPVGALHYFWTEPRTSRVGKELVLVSFWKSVTKDIVPSISSSGSNRRCCCAINPLMRMLLRYIGQGPMMSELLPATSKVFQGRVPLDQSWQPVIGSHTTPSLSFV